MERKKLPSRRKHVTQKARIGAGRIAYVSMGFQPGVREPQELFIRVKGAGACEEIICLYDVIARLISLGLQSGVALDALANCLHGTRTTPCGPVQGDERIKMCDGVPDYVGRYLLVNFAGREDLAHVRKEAL